MNKYRIKYFLLIFLLSGLVFSCQMSKTQSNDFETTIVKVVKAFKEKDTLTLNNLINKDKGLIVLFKRGVFNEYSKTLKIDFKNPVPEYLPYYNITDDVKIQYESLPVFDCDNEKWSKFGLFCDTLLVDRLLSGTAINLNQFRANSIPESEIKNFIELEKASKRIIFTNKEGGELIFYLSKINNQWYLTILDRASSDCSA